MPMLLGKKPSQMLHQSCTGTFQTFGGILITYSQFSPLVFQSKQTRKNGITELEDISLCSLHIKNSMDTTQSNQLGRARIRSHTVWRDEGIGPESPTTPCSQHSLYPQAVRAPEDERVPQATPLDVLNCEVWCGETRRGKV